MEQALARQLATQTFSYHSARLTCQRKLYNAMEAAYFGPISEVSFAALAPHALAAVNHASAVIVRMDSCVVLMDEFPVIPDGYHRSTPPGCVVVTREQFPMWSDYSRRLALRGVRRIVFLDSQLDLAWEWLERRSVPRAHPSH